MADDIKFVIGVDDRDLIKAQKEQLKFQRNLLTIEKAYRKGDITAKRYNAELNKQTRELQKLGGTYKQASSEVRKFAYQLRTADDAALAASTSYALAGKNVNRMGMKMQQAGYQIGDFAVQVQGGTNVMVALGQQGAQLLGIFGAGGAIAGAALAITTAIIAPLFAARKEAKGLADDVKTSLKELRKEVELSGLGATKAEAPYIDAITIAMLELDEAQKRLNARRSDVLKQGETSSRFWSRETEQVKTAQDILKFLNKDYQEFISLRSMLSSQDPLSPFGGSGPDIEGDKRRKELLLEQVEIRQNIISLQDIESVNGKRSVSYLEEMVSQQIEAENKQIDLLDLTIDQKDQLKALNLEIQNFNLKLATSVINSANLANNLKTAATFNTGGVGGEFADVPTGLDSFGGGGDYKYDLPSSFRPPKPKKTGGGGAKESPQEKLAKYLQGKQQELTLEKQLVGVFGAERDIKSELFEVEQEYGNLIDTTQDSQLAGTLRQIEAEKERHQALEEAQAQQQSMADTLQSSMSDAFMSMVDGTKSFKDAMKDMARSVIKQLYDILVVQRLVGSFDSKAGTGSGLVGMIMGAFQANGGAWQGGSQIKAYADGGVVGGPTTFPMAGGKTGLMGEAGPEAIMPLKRGANGKLGVQMEGGGGQNVVINQSFNFQANGDDSVKKIIAQAAPQIAQMTKSSLLNDRRRGGATKAAFG